MEKKLIIRPLVTAFIFFFCLLPSVGKAQTPVNCATAGALQAAINAAGAGATLLVSGTCNENVFIGEDKDRITLDGQNSATISGLPANSATSPTIQVRGKGISIRNFASITGGQDGILVIRRGTAIIINNTIHNNARHGININENSSARIGFIFGSDTVASPNTIRDNGGRGILVSRSSNARIAGGSIYGNGDDGIAVDRVSHANISNVTIGASGNGGDGVFVAQNSSVNLGNDTGTTIFDLPNSTTSNNFGFGIRCVTNSSVDGRLASLNGISGPISLSGSCTNSLADTADLAVSKSDLPDPATAGSSLTYTITVTNNGPGNATGVTLTDNLPASVQLFSVAQSQGSCSGTTTITCNLGTIANGSSATVSIVVTLTVAGGLSNTASVAANEVDPNTANNMATATTTVNAAPVVSTTSLPAGTVGTAYASFLAFTGGSAPLTWSVVAGALPAGFTLSSDGIISGAPTTASISNFTVRATDANGAFDDQALTIVVETGICVAPPSGLVSWWPGDGNANDIRGGNNGTLQGGVTFAAGKVEQAFSFDGVDDFISIPVAANLGMTSAYTFDAWVKFDETNLATFRPLAIRGTTNSHDIDIYGQFTTNNICVVHNRGNGGVLSHRCFVPPPLGTDSARVHVP